MLKKSLLGSSATMPDMSDRAEPKYLSDDVAGLVKRQLPVESLIKPKPPTDPSTTGDSTLCIDCGVETQPTNPGATHDYEQYIVTDEVWQAARTHCIGL
jgi:hypothetical protein